MLSSKPNQIFQYSLLLSFFAISHSHAAAVLDPTTEPLNVLAPYATSASDVSSGTVKAYRPWFENGAWQGDLIEYSISSGGLLSSSVDSTVAPPTNTAGTNWSARLQFDAAVTASSSYWDNSRKIIFHNGTSQKAFRWANLSVAQQTALDADAQAASAASSDYLNYVRGDQSKETDKTDGTLRQRFNLLGNIIHSNPVYVAAPDTDFSLPGYSAFKTMNTTGSPVSGQADRAPRVYVSSNDGMVHAFDALTGDEEWAYIPSMIIGELDNLAAIPFTHNYFVDGQLSEGDADFSATTTPDWHSLLVGGLGSGGKGLFALDITHASLSTETANSGNNKKILWEKDGSDTDMGYIHGKAQVVRLEGNKWFVATGNGYGSTTGKAKLLMYDKDGAVTKVSTNNTTSNGLSAMTFVDVEPDNDVDYGYAGDLQGNLWKFDFTVWPVTAQILHTAGVNKPITTEPDVRRHPNGGWMVYFGTGSLLSATDAASTTTQSVYGIWDGAPGGNTTILTQTMGTETYSYDPGAGAISFSVRTTTNNVIDWSIHKGWQVDLNISGEKMVTNPIIRADRLQFISHNTNPATAGGTRGDAWLLELNYLNGGTGAGVFFDLNRDTFLKADDKANGKIPVGINLGQGSFSGPTISRVSNSRDTMFINGLYLALEEPKTENTHFQGGHIDVDTDSATGGLTATTVSDSYCYAGGDRASGIPIDDGGDPIPPSTNSPTVRPGTGGGDGLGGSTDGHHHEYDVAHNQVYVDYINLEPLCSEKLNRVTETKIPYNKKFLVIISNADLSPGSTLQIGAKKWNVVEFQEMMHRKLGPYLNTGAMPNGATRNNFEAAMIDDEGDSLIFTLDDIIAAGTFRHAFNDRAILDGGLLPTQTGCVKSDPTETLGGTSNKERGRWRGGALITQVIGLTEFEDDTTTIVEQEPTDLYKYREINGTKIWLKEDKYDETTNPAPTDLGQDGVYETYLAGGLRARYWAGGVIGGTITPNPAFLYESTLFWHYKGACYGSPSWAANVNGALNSSSLESLKSQLAPLELNLSEAEDLLALMDANPGDYKSKDIKKQRQLVEDLKKKIQEIKDLIAASDTSIENQGVPTPPTDADPDISPVLGPNFRTGRRTWIDLTP